MPLSTENVFEILERITDGFFAVDHDWNFTYVNSEAARLLFRNRDDLIGRNIWSEFPEAVELPFYQQYHKAVMSQVPVQFESYYYPLNAWFDVRAYPSPNGLTVYFRDSSLEKMEATKKEQHYHSLFQHNPDGVFSFDLEGNYLSVNPAMEELLGYSEREYLNKSFVPFVFKEDLERTITHYQNAAGGKTQRYENKGIHRDGSIVHFDVTNMPIIVNDDVVGVYGIAKDITSRKKSESELIVKTQQLESFIENNVDAILIFNNDEKIIRVNKAFEDTFGWTKKEMEEGELSHIPMIPPEKFDEVRKNVEKVKNGNHTIGFESIRLRKDGTELNVTISLSPIMDEQGNIDGWSVILRDITESIKSQEMLRNTEKLSIAGQLAAGIAHEIRNPLTAIKGFVKLIDSDSNSHKEYFRIISSEIERIEEILSELLILAKPKESQFERCNINLLLEQIVTLLETQAILNNVEINVECETAETFVKCDQNQLKQVFINYIKNAIEAMPNGGNLIVQLSEINGQLKVCFQDEGVGMSKESLEKLGQPFYTTKEKGTGLGFMVSKRIIENHLGEVQIMSEENKGTTIDVWLPLNL